MIFLTVCKASAASDAAAVASTTMKTSAEKDLVDWAKEILLNAKPQVKVTNLTSAWRNGLGFCIILHKKHPEWIPLEAPLSSDNARDNNEIAFDVADLLGIDTEAIRQMALVKEVTDKRTVSDFLIQLRTYVTEGMTERPPEKVRFTQLHSNHLVIEN